MDDEIKIEKDMTPKLIGDTYLKKPKETSRCRESHGIYECQYCGKEFEAITAHIKSGNTRSCGCRAGFVTHGLSHNQFYKTWKSMMGRCYYLKNKHYQSYGGRGITVCDEWLDVANFVAWAEETYIEGMTMDRINNDGNYEPTNIRWADKTTQQLNQRIQKNNTSGFVGINWHKGNNKWVAKIKVNKIVIHLGYFNSVQEAVEARDNYIIENNLSHKLSTDYKKEN